MSHTPYLNVCIQRHRRDCAVATLSMLVGRSYEEVLVAFRHDVISEGASIRQIQNAARRLGRRVAWIQRRIDLEVDTGILVIESPKWKPFDHLVLLKEGLIVDTDATIWESDVFMSAYKARPISILTLTE